MRGDSASDCPDAAAIEAQAAARLGDNPFRRPPGQFIEAVVTRPMDTFQVNIAMRGTDGKLIGNRTLSSAAGDCRSIANAAALTIAILIDPDAILRSAPTPAPPAPAAPPPAPSGPKGRVVLIALGGYGKLPQPALGAGLSATLDVSRRAAIGVVTGYLPERRTTPDDGFGFGLAFAELLGCFVPVPGDSSPLRFELCAGISANVLHAVVYGAGATDPGQRWYAGLSQLTRLIIPIGSIALAEVGLGASEAVPRRSFFVEGRPPGMDTVFTQPAVAVTAWTGVGLRWR